MYRVSVSMALSASAHVLFLMYYINEQQLVKLNKVGMDFEAMGSVEQKTIYIILEFMGEKKEFRIIKPRQDVIRTRTFI